MDTKCRLCGKHLGELRGAYLTRVNEKGAPGVWECRPMCEADLSQETLLLMAIDGEPEETPNAQVTGDSPAFMAKRPVD